MCLSVMLSDSVLTMSFDDEQQQKKTNKTETAIFFRLNTNIMSMWS